jgi:hypothetical protein
MERGGLGFGMREIDAGLQAILKMSQGSQNTTKSRLQPSVPKHSKVKVATQPKQQIKNHPKINEKEKFKIWESRSGTQI